MPTSWLQCTVRAEPSALDAIAHFLIERGSPGVLMKKREVQGYFPQEDETPSWRRNRRGFLRNLQAIYPGIREKDLRWRTIKDRNWNSAWQKFFTPQTIGKSFIVCPPWAASPPLQRRHLITIEPGLAFGTGTHATTRGCMELMETAAASLPGGPAAALDVGTGSGILAIALVKLGVKKVWAIDQDPVALKVAGKNLKDNGTAHAVRLSRGPLQRMRRSFPLVVANLTAETIMELRDVLVKRVALGGYLVLSGILREKARRVVGRFADDGFRLLQRRREKEWVSLLLRRYE